MEELIQIQARLIAPKSQYNSFGKYNYRNLEDILTGVKPLLDELSCRLIISDDVVQIGERYYVKASAILMNSKGETMTVTGMAREPHDRKGMDESQITGAASSYARKYALNGLFCIDDTKDADSVLNVTEAEIDAFSDLVESGDGAALYLMERADVDKYITLANKAAPKGSKGAFKTRVGELTKAAYNDAAETAVALSEASEKEETYNILEITEDLTRQQKILVWQQLKPEVKAHIEELLKEAA